MTLLPGAAELNINLKLFFDEALRSIELQLLNLALNSQNVTKPEFVVMNQFTYDNLVRGAIAYYPQLSMQIDIYKTIRGLKIAIFAKDYETKNELLIKVC